jgi:hypothetical protein
MTFTLRGVSVPAGIHQKIYGSENGGLCEHQLHLC